MIVTDTHCHLYWRSFDEDRSEVLARARAAGVQRMVVVGLEVETSQSAAELADSDRRGSGAPLACTPTTPRPDPGAMRASLEELCARGDCSPLVGGIGLDWFKDFSPREAQLDSFAWHLDLAADLDKPVIVHCRDAHEATAELVSSHRLRRGVMHCYAYGPEELAPYLEAGYHVSFSDVVTYPRNEANPRRPHGRCPADRLLVETDNPYLAHLPHRRERNEPALVVPILERVAEERGEDAERARRADRRERCSTLRARHR